MKKITPKIVISKISEAIILALLAFITIIPIYWGIVTSLKNKNEIATYPPKVIGFNVTWSNYVRIVGQGYLRALGNSAFYSLVTIILCLILGYIAGYGFERRNFLFKKFWFSLVVIGIPLSTGCSVLLIPNYLMMMKLHMTNHIYTMPIIYATYNLPLCIWMMISGVRSLPVEIEESAKIDGCSQRYIIARLIPPIIKPSFAAAGIFIFIGAWNEYISTSVMINSRELKNVQMAIYDYMGFFGQEWGPLCAAATAAIIPILVVFTILGKQLVSGLTAGAVKG